MLLLWSIFLRVPMALFLGMHRVLGFQLVRTGRWFTVVKTVGLMLPNMDGPDPENFPVLFLCSPAVSNTGPSVTIERLELVHGEILGCNFNFSWPVWVQASPYSQITDSCSSCEACKMQIGSFLSDAHPAVVVIFSLGRSFPPFFFLFPPLLANAYLSFSKGDFLLYFFGENSGDWPHMVKSWKQFIYRAVNQT